MEQEIVQCEEKFLQAIRTANVEEAASLLHDGLIYNTPTGQAISKEEDIQEFKSSSPKIEKMECVERKVQLFGDTAIVSTVIYMKATFMEGQHKIDGKARFFRTWKKFEDGWKVIGAASVNLA